MHVRTEERIGSLIAATGIIWAINTMTHGFAGLAYVNLPVGPREVAAIGILIWIHAKWRRSVRTE
ncbi:MAG TPA: hypothetical protein VF938_06645 [Candidatus Angelobacter sp.]